MKSAKRFREAAKAMRRHANIAARRGDLAAAERWTKLRLLHARLENSHIDLLSKTIKEARRLYP